MRALLLLLALTASTASAHPVLVGDPPPPPPPPPPHVDAPPPRVEVPYVRPLLGDRWTVVPQVGVAWIRVHRMLGGGPVVAPTVTRTFDRFELSAEYLVMDWIDATGMASSGTLHRLGGEARYQLVRARMKDATFDFVGTTGLGLQHLVQDHGPSIDRPDVSLGVVLRMLSDMDEREKPRMFFGFEFGAKLVVAAAKPSDLGVVLAFGVPLGW